MPAPVTDLKARVEKARGLMREQGIDGLIVTDPLNFGYFTGQNVPLWMAARPAMVILPQSGEPTVIDWSGPSMFNRLYKKPSANWIADKRIYPEIPIQEETPVDWGVADILAEKGLTGGKIAIELGYETRLNLAQEDFELIRKQLPKVTWVDSGPVTWPCRMEKSAWEIEQLKKACAITVQVWSRLFDDLKTGMTGPQMQARIMKDYIDLGADLDSGAPITLGATGPGGTFQNGDILYIDGGCKVQGYRADFTRRVVFGQPSQRQLDEHNGMWDILTQVMDKMKVGVSTREIFAFSQSLLAKHPDWTNYSSHPSLRIGHGIGLGNEPPYLNAYDKNILGLGMSITPEPKIETVEGLLNPEEHIIMGPGGAEIISVGLDTKLRVI
jgi:Xaa-Pro aminopeptidase